MSFNIRYGTAADGEDHWEKRREMLFTTIEAFQPDLLGTQEVVAFQADELKKRLKGHGFVGAGRDDGKDKGEMTPIYFRATGSRSSTRATSGSARRRRRPAARGGTPPCRGSPPGSSCATRRRSGEFTFLNTHFDHRGQKARLESAKLVRKRLEALPGDPPVVVTGDFNTGEGSEPYKALVGGDGLKLTDSYRAVHPERKKDEGTFNGFKGTRTGARIDWIVYTNHFAATAATIDHTNKDGRYPSDHYPVTAALKWK